MADNTEPRPALPKQLPASNRAGFGIAAAKSAYHYPLIIKHLWHAPLLQAADQEIVYRDLRRFTYREFRERVGRLASALAGMGVRPGDTARGRPGERGGEAGLPIATVRTFEEFRKEPQYAEVLSRMPLISVEKIGESEPIPFKKDGKSPLDGIRAFGMGHVIAGAGMGRDLACYGAGCVRQSWTTPKTTTRWSCRGLPAPSERCSRREARANPSGWRVESTLLERLLKPRMTNSTNKGDPNECDAG